MAAKTNVLKVTLPSDREIKLTRDFDAPRHLVFEALSKPEYIRQWWGPRGTELTTCEMDFRTGGTWRFVSRGPDGVEHPFTGVYREVSPPDRVVWTFIYDVPPINEHEAVETVTLTERDGRTTITVISVHDSKESRDMHVQSGMEKGAAETYDRLEELLAKLA
jgi:uncharacterized protein YndB with AHSA1/START domain